LIYIKAIKTKQKQNIKQRTFLPTKRKKEKGKKEWREGGRN
jgi:hypothetical protein